MPAALPRLTLQTASLYASNTLSRFTGTGGPFGFNVFTSQFGGVVSSAGIAGEPFADTVYNVAAGDEVTFVVAVQNMAPGAPAYAVRLRDIMPPGFTAPPEGIGLTVTNGAGTELAYGGDLFSTAGLSLADPLGGYDADSGLNVGLVTFSLMATTALPGPSAQLASSATVVGYSAAPGGPDLAGGNPATANTTVVTASPVPLVTPETDPSAVAKGQTVAFDVAVAIPAGVLQDLVLSPAAAAGAATLVLVSAAVLSIGAGLQTGTPTIAADGSIHFGTVSFAGGAGSNAITARVVVRADGSVSGIATLQIGISAVDTSNAGARWSATVPSSVGVVVPPPPPTLSGLSPLQSVIGTAVHPYGGLVIGAGNLGQTGSLAVTLLDTSLGRLGTAGAGSLNASGTTFAMTGVLSALQAAARALVFTPTANGTAHFTVTVVDAGGGVAQNASETVTTAPAPPPKPDPLFDAAYYLAHNPDVAKSKVDPYQHYLTIGWKQGRNPNALFDTNYYLAHNPDVAKAGVNPLLHFSQNGWKEGRPPDAWFDPSFYLAQNPDVRASGVNPLLQFEQTGWKLGRDPSLLFSVSLYRAAYRDIAAAGVNPLIHYVNNGQAEHRLSFLAGGLTTADPLVDAGYYDRQLGAKLLSSGAAAAQQAARAYHNGGGWQAGLNPDAWFDTKYYLAHNADVAAAHVDPLLHFETRGWKEGRNPSASFSTAKYLAAYADVRRAGVDPLLHFITSGHAEGRTAFAV